MSPEPEPELEPEVIMEEGAGVLDAVGDAVGDAEARQVREGTPPPRATAAAPANTSVQQPPWFDPKLVDVKILEGVDK